MNSRARLRVQAPVGPRVRTRLRASLQAGVRPEQEGSDMRQRHRNVPQKPTRVVRNVQPVKAPAFHPRVEPAFTRLTFPALEPASALLKKPKKPSSLLG